MSWHLLMFLGLPGFVLYPAEKAIAAPPQLVSYPKVVSLKFPPTVQRGAPPRTAGGGTRGPSCIQGGSTPLTALMPSNNVGITVAANPTFFWYVPQTIAQSAKFVVVDDQNKLVYQTNLDLTGTPGIVQKRLPPTTSLKVGKTYHWSFTLNCNPQNPTTQVEGWVERTALAPDLKTELQQASPLEQAKIYAEAGIWQETLTILASLRHSQPQEWEELIQSVGLDSAIATAPFAHCCTALK